MHNCQLIETRFGIICVARGHQPGVRFVPPGVRGAQS